MSEMLDTTLPTFHRFHFRHELATRIGEGEIGGKAAGLCRLHNVMRSEACSIPRFVVVATDVFDEFIAHNNIDIHAIAGLRDEEIALAFQQAELPAMHLGDLRALAQEVSEPLAVRSSSMLEDALAQPFAGVYETKMIPNNAPESDVRFQRLTEAIKLVYASTYFAAARSYREACGIADNAEKMAVLLQEIVGARHGQRFYPHVSVVARSFSYYPIAGTRSEDGFASLALGLGKTIVDGGLCWSYSPRHPRKPPPFGSVRDLVRMTQQKFWAVALGATHVYNPIAETEYLQEFDLEAAEYDDVLRWVASTYDAESDRMRPGTGRSGARVVNFAPILQLGEVPLNTIIVELLQSAKDALQCDVEIELAAVLPTAAQPTTRVGVVQARPMMAAHEEVDLESLMARGRLLLSSSRVLGNGVLEDVRDIVYVRPDGFDWRFTRDIASELAQLNAQLVKARRPYVLVGFGRWGSSDPWLGIPMSWGHVAGARAIVEATLPGVNTDPSEGSHFFHNLSSMRVQYFSAAGHEVDWQYLDSLPAEYTSGRIRHVRLLEPLVIASDARTGRGVILAPAPADQ